MNMFPDFYYASEKECQNKHLRSSDFHKSFVWQDGESGNYHRRFKYAIFIKDAQLGIQKEVRIIRSFPA